MSFRLRTRPPAAMVITLMIVSASASGCASETAVPASDIGSTAGSRAEASLWRGPKPTTTAMSPADARAIDAVGEQIITNMGADLPGVWIGVWDAQKGYRVGAYGKAALPDTAATVDDHSRIGSVSKTFTTATVMRLIDQGTLTDDSVELGATPTRPGDPTSLVMWHIP